MNFAHLHCHSYFSMMHGTVSLERLCQAAVQNGMTALALTDLGGIYGWVEFVQTCEHYGLHPICGVELQANDASAVLLAKSRLGYERLCRIISDFHLFRKKDSFFLKKVLLQDRHHLAILTRDLPLLQTLHRKGGPEDLYVEILPRSENFSRLQFAKETGVKPVAANDVYFINPQEFAVHRLLRAIDQNKTLSHLDSSSLLSPDRFFCDEMTLRRQLSYAPESVDNAVALTESLMSSWPLGQTIFPPFGEFSDPEAYFQLRWRCYRGARRRYGSLNPKITRRLDYELKVIREKGFTHYFLVVEDIVRRAPRTCGRGSVAASIVSYCLGITHVDPLAMGLLFERFLNPGRRDPPDADIDFPWDERDDILDYIFEKYGPYRAAMVANHVRIQKRAAIREVAKVYGLPEAEIKTMSRRLRRFPPKRIPQPWDEILNWAGCIDDFPRHLSVHCGGVVIVPDDLRCYVPLERAPKGVNIIQWEKDQTEDFGLVKIDILGNRSLAVIRDALAEVRHNTGEALSYENLDPIDDPATQSMMERGETMGVFYVESPATRQLQQKAGKGDYEHLVIHSSIIRPAAHRFINEYVERLHGKPYLPIHPLLSEILSETFGIMVYQEDVTKAAMAIAGFDSVEADGLRKVLSKKRPYRMLQEYRRQFYEGAIARGVGLAEIEKIWEMMMSFAGYSFCKPHSASYALVSFQSAYLRAHYPAEFMAAVITNGGGYYSTFAYLSEARRMGLTVLLPDINASAISYTGRGDKLRVGLMQLKGVQEKSLEAIMEQREKRPFDSFEDFLKRVLIDLSDTKLLIRAGCFDSVAHGYNRSQLLWKLLQLHRPKKRFLSFSFRDPKPWIPEVSDYSAREKLQDEQEIFGFLISRHPLTLYQEELADQNIIAADQMKKHVSRRVRMVGWLITSKVVLTKNDDPMSFISFEDLTAIYDTVFFPKAYKRFAPQLNAYEPFLLTGTIEEDHGTLALHVQWVVAVRKPKPRHPPTNLQLVLKKEEFGLTNYAAIPPLNCRSKTREYS